MLACADYFLVADLSHASKWKQSTKTDRQRKGTETIPLATRDKPPIDYLCSQLNLQLWTSQIHFLLLFNFPLSSLSRQCTLVVRWKHPFDVRAGARAPANTFSFFLNSAHPSLEKKKESNGLNTRSQKERRGKKRGTDTRRRSLLSAPKKYVCELVLFFVPPSLCHVSI